MPTVLSSTVLVFSVGLLVPAASSVAEGPGLRVDGVANARVIESVEVTEGLRTTIYKRIETPALKPQVKAAQSGAAQAMQEHVPTAEELAEARRWESLRYEEIGGTATVFDGVGTEFRIWTPEGEVVARSSMDFNWLQTLWGFEREGAYYNVSLFAMGVSGEEASASGGRAAFPTEVDGLSRYALVAAPKGGAAESVIAALEDLHAYFDQNRKHLRAALEQSENERVAQEAAERAQPPRPTRTTVTYFPIRSSQLTAAEKARLSGADR